MHEQMQEIMPTHRAIAGQAVCPYFEPSGPSAPHCLATSSKPRVSTRYIDAYCGAKQHNSCQLYLAASHHQSARAPSLVSHIRSRFHHLKRALGFS
jgi:hypothetical protein